MQSGDSTLYSQLMATCIGSGAVLCGDHGCQKQMLFLKSLKQISPFHLIADFGIEVYKYPVTKDCRNLKLICQGKVWYCIFSFIVFLYSSNIKGTKCGLGWSISQ